MNDHICTECGQTLPRARATWQHVPLRGFRHIIFDALCERPYGLTARELISIIYLDPNDEPKNPEKNIRLAILRANHQFQTFNSPFRIKKVTLGRYALFLRRVRK